MQNELDWNAKMREAAAVDCCCRRANSGEQQRGTFKRLLINFRYYQSEKITIAAAK